MEERSQPQKPFVITFNKPEIDGTVRFVLIEVEENAVLAITRVTTVQAVLVPSQKQPQHNKQTDPTAITVVLSLDLLLVCFHIYISAFP